jgi:hypothetical protein
MSRLEQLLVGIVFYLAAGGIVDAAGNAADATAAPLERGVASYQESLAGTETISFAELQKRAAAQASGEPAARTIVVSTQSAHPESAAPARPAAAAREPSSWMMLIVGLVVAGFMARRISGAGTL